MHMAAAIKHWTLEELHRLPDDGNKYELVRGELFVTPPPSDDHETIIAKLARRLEPFVEAQHLGFVYHPRAVVRAEEVEAQAAGLIERQQWQAAVDALHSGEPLGPRGTNMLGRALAQLGDKEGARHAFERTLAREPDNRIALRQLEGLNS